MTFLISWKALFTIEGKITVYLVNLWINSVLHCTVVSTEEVIYLNNTILPAGIK